MRSAALFLAAVVSILDTAEGKPDLSVEAGNIFIVVDGVQKQLTSSGKDSRPVVSPDGKWVVFVRAASRPTIATGSEERPAAELWQIRADGKETTLLLRTQKANDMKQIIAGFDNAQFSSDGALVYFETPAWATSGALHVVDTRTRKEHFVCASNAFEVVPSGKYRDHLLVNQHRYFIGAGSYDWFWLFTPAGKEIGRVGEDTENFKSTWTQD